MSDAPGSAMIFAAGFGTRMGSLAKDVPKPLVQFAGRPMIDHAIDLVREAGVSHILANTHHLHNRIAPYLEGQGVVVHHEEPDILDTGGGLKAARPLLTAGPIYTLNPDAAWTGKNPLIELREAWRPEMQGLLLLAPVDSEDDPRTGDFSLYKGEIARNGPFKFTGAQIIRTDALAQIQDKIFSLNAYWDLLLDNGALHGLVHEGSWCDIGTPEGLKRGEELIASAGV